MRRLPSLEGVERLERETRKEITDVTDLIADRMMPDVIAVKGRADRAATDECLTSAKWSLIGLRSLMSSV